MSTADILYNDNGIVRLYDGTVIYIEKRQYSSNGISKWEDIYYPTDHPDPDNPTQTIGPHLYTRVKHTGDADYQLAQRIAPQDAELRVYNNTLQWKYLEQSEDQWQDLYDLTTLEGEQGPVGADGSDGDGWHIDYYGALDSRPACNAVPNSSCNSCNPNSVSGTDPVTFLSAGNHLLVTADIGNGSTYYHTYDGSSWVQSTDEDLGKSVIAYVATADNDTNNDAYTVNAQGQTVLFSSLATAANSQGKVYGCTNSDTGWVEVANVTAETGMVKISSGDNLQYFSFKVDGVTLEAYDSGSNGYLDKIRVADAGIDENKLDSSVAGNGLTGGAGSVLAVGAGAGITANANDIEVKLLATQVGADGDSGVNNNPIYKDSTEGINIKIDGSTIGLDSTNAYRLYVPDAGINIDQLNASVAGDGLTGGAGSALAVNVDDSTIETDSDAIRVKDAGITGPKLASTVAGEGLSQNLSGNLDVNYDDETIGLSGDDILVKDNGITGAKLNDNTCDTTKGVEISNDAIVAKIDTDKLEFDNGDISVKDSYVESLDGIIVAGTQYGNMRIIKSGAFAGIQLWHADSSTWFRLEVVDAAGSLDTTAVT